MEVFNEYLMKQEPIQRAYLEELFEWIEISYPQLEAKIAWNQPMFTHEKTFIIAFSCSKKHLAVAPEGIVVKQFSSYLDSVNLDYGKEVIRMPWGKPFDYKLIGELIEYNLKDKAGCQTFWRK